MFRPVVSGAAALVMLAMAHLATPAGAHPAGACTPVLEKPAQGAAVTPQFDVRVKVDMSTNNCQVDRIRLRVFDKGADNMVFSRQWECCDVITNRDPVVDFSIPDGELREDTTYIVSVRFYDKHIGFSPGSDPAMAEVRTTIPQYRTKRQAQGFQPMVFAVNRKGRFGHGKAGSAAQARRTALDFCDAPGCEIVSKPVRARCHALAQRTRGGYWWGVGAGGSEDAARDRAKRFCEQNQQGSCKISYTHCQQ
jgi:hypothetical protein